MKPLIIAVFVFLSFSLFCQGGFDIEYIPRDSIDSSYIGDLFRLDFGVPRTFQSPNDIRLILNSQDSAPLLINGQQVLFKEQRKIYDDMVLYRDQYIVNENDQNYSCGRIEDMRLIRMDGHKWTFQADFIVLEKRKKVKEVRSVEVIIMSDDLAGLIKKP